MSSESAAFRDAVRGERPDLGLACLLLAADLSSTNGRTGVAQQTVVRGLAALDDLAARVPESGEASSRLRRALGHFSGDASDYRDLRASLLPDVLDRQRGLPILLSVVWLEVARRVSIPAYGIGLPGHFVVGLGDPDGYHQVVDPFAGGRLLRPVDVVELVERATGAAPEPTALRPWEAVEILQRILANVRRWADRPERLPVRRWAIERNLDLPRHPLSLRKEHGTVMVQLGGFVEGATALEEYADLVAPADPAEADEVRRLARSARARLN